MKREISFHRKRGDGGRLSRRARIIPAFWTIAFFLAAGSPRLPGWPSDQQTRSIHLQLTEKAFSSVQKSLKHSFLQSNGPAIASYTTYLVNDTPAHGNNISRNLGPIQEHFVNFLYNFRTGRNDEAARNLAYCIHLIEDMNVPAHAFNIPHYNPPARLVDNFELASWNRNDISAWLTDPQANLASQPEDPASYFFTEAARAARSNVAASSFAGYWHEGQGDPWCGAYGIPGCQDGPAGYYTQSGSLVDVDLFPAMVLPGSGAEAFLKSQLNESVRWVSLFLLSVDRSLAELPAQPAVLAFPRLIQTPGEWTGLAVVNHGPDSARLTFRAFGNDGRTIPGADPARNPLQVTLPSGRQYSAVASQIFGESLQTAGGWIRLESDRRQVAGFFLSFDSELRQMDGTDVSERLYSSLVFPEAGNSEISLVNPNAKLSSQLTIQLFSDQGALQGSPVYGTVPPLGRFAARLSSLFPGSAAEGGGYLAITSSLAVAAVQTIAVPGAYTRNLNAMNANEGARTLYAPQFVIGDGYRSSLTLVNLESSSAAVSLRWMDDQGRILGQPASVNIPGRGRKAISDASLFRVTPPGSGYLVMESDRRLGGAVLFGDDTGAGFQTSLPLAYAGQKDLVYSQLAQNDTYYTGVAVLNPGTAEANLQVSAYDADGMARGMGWHKLGPGCRFSRLLSQLIPGLPALSKGYFLVRSDQPVFSFAVFGTRTFSVLSAIPAPTPLP